MVLGTAELLRDRQFDLDFLGLAEVVARHLVARIGHGLRVFLAEWELDACETGFFPELALRAGQLVFARLHQSLWEVPVLVGAQDQVVDAAAGAAEHHHARRARWRFGFHRGNATEISRGQSPFGEWPRV